MPEINRYAKSESEMELNELLDLSQTNSIARQLRLMPMRDFLRINNRTNILQRSLKELRHG